MNKYTLQLKNKKIRKQYEAEDLEVLKKHVRNIAVVITITVVAQIILLGIDGETNYKMYLYFGLYLVGSLATFTVSCCFLSYLKIFHTLNVLLYVSLILWSFVDPELKQKIEAEKSLTPFVRGFFLCIQFFVYNVSSYFPFQALMNIYIFVLLLASASNNPLMDSVKLIPMLIALIYKGYYDDKGKKRRFLMQKKDDVWDHLTNELLPTSLIIVKWDQEFNRIEFYSQNKQAQNDFKLQSTEDFNEFSRKFVLEEVGQKVERQRSLRKSEIKWENTLLFQIKNKIEKEKVIFDNCDEPLLFSEKDLSENNFFRKFAQLSKTDSNFKKSVSNANLSNKKAVSPKNKLDLIADQFNGSKLDNEVLGKVDYYIGENRQKNFEVSDESDRYSVRIGAYFINEWFGVISIENESYRDRYQKQKKQYQNLMKQINQNYEYLLHCSRQNIENTRELYTKILQQQSGLQQKGGEFKLKQKGQTLSDNNLGSYYNCDKSMVIDTENTLNEPIKECSSYLENKSPIAAVNARRNNHQNHSQPQKSSQGDERITLEVRKQKSLQRNGQQQQSSFPPQHSASNTLTPGIPNTAGGVATVPPTFGSEVFQNNILKLNNAGDFNNNQNSLNFQEQNLDLSSKNINQSLFIKKNTNNKSSLLIQENNYNQINININNNNINNNSNNINTMQIYTDFNNSTNNNNINIIQNQAHVAYQPQNKMQRIDLDALNETCNTPISTKIVNNPIKQMINQISESTKAMYTAILLKTTILNQILISSKQKYQATALAEHEQFKGIKKANLKQVISNITGLFRYNLNDRGSDLLIKYDENLPQFLTQDQTKLTQLLFNCLNLMVINTQPSYQLLLNISTDNINQSCNTNQQENENQSPGIIQKTNHQTQAAVVTVYNHTLFDYQNNADDQKQLKTVFHQQQQNQFSEGEKDQVLKFVIKSKLTDIVTCQVPNYHDMKINILEHGFEQVFAKNAISACQRIIKDIGPYSKIKLQFDPSDCTFFMTFSVYTDLGVLTKRKSLVKGQKRSLNNMNNYVGNNYSNPHKLSMQQQNFVNNVNINNIHTKNGAQTAHNRDRMESNMIKSYNIMSLSEENFLKTKDVNFNQILSKQVNCRTIQILETIHPNPNQQDSIQQLKTNNNLINSPLNQVDFSTHQRMMLPQSGSQDKQFQDILKKQNTNHYSSRQFNQASSLGLIDGNTMPSYIVNQKGKPQELSSSQEISQNQHRSLLHHNSVSNIIQQHTNITID